MDSLSDFPYRHSQGFKLSEHPSDEKLQDVCDMISGRMKNLVQPDPKVSVVFPAFNEEMYLPLMLWTLSKLATTTPIEIIWVDNASSDRTGEIIEQCGITRIDEKKKWVSYARQAGLENAKWQLIATTDADTQVPEAWIDANLAYFSENPDLVCFSGGSNPNGGHISYWVLRSCVRSLRKWLNKDVSANWSFPGHNMYYNRESALKVGGYEAGVDLWEDNLLARKLRQHGDILRVDDISSWVITSARRVATFWKVLAIISSRIQNHVNVLDYNRLSNYKWTFSDIR